MVVVKSSLCEIYGCESKGFHECRCSAVYENRYWYSGHITLCSAHYKLFQTPILQPIKTKGPGRYLCKITNALNFVIKTHEYR